MIREREWLGKQVPKKGGTNQRELKLISSTFLKEMIIGLLYLNILKSVMYRNMGPVTGFRHHGPSYHWWVGFNL